MTRIEIKNTSPKFIAMVKLEVKAKKERMEGYFSKIKNMKKEKDAY